MTTNNQLQNTNYVNGPVNIIRLQGKIGNIDKAIYLFMDYHIDVDDQTQCTDLFSKDVQKYFTDNFFELSQPPNSKMYDFFLEIFPDEIARATKQSTSKSKNPSAKPKIEHKDMYIEEVVKVFNKIIKYDSGKKKVVINNLFKNIRLHYLDIRNYFMKDSELRHELNNEVRDLIRIDHVAPKRLISIIDSLTDMKQNFEHIVKILLAKNSKVKKSTVIKEKINYNEYDNNTLNYISNKLKQKYKHSQVKTSMNRLINEMVRKFKDTINYINETIKRFDGYIDIVSTSSRKLVKDKNTDYIYVYGISQYSMRKMLFDIVNTVEMLIDEKYVEFFARFTDIFFLRRFLDKDYITNAIVYSGAMHSNTYIHILVNEFNFKITHASYSLYTNMDKLNNEIKQKSLMEIQPLILPPTLIQCSNMEKFPKKFE